MLAPDQPDAAALKQLGIVLACDLRSDSERLHAPNGWWHQQQVEVIDMDLLRDIPHDGGPWAILRADSTATGARAAMRSVYAALPRASVHHVGVLIGRILAGDLPLLIHCTAGKDRTGFMSAILLGAIGVRHEEIVADYLASRDRRTTQVEEATRTMVLARAESDLDTAALEAMMGVEEEYLLASFAAIAADYGDLPGYLSAADIGSAAVADLRARLLE